MSENRVHSFKSMTEIINKQVLAAILDCKKKHQDLTYNCQNLLIP
jgi:hypothetical protein